MMNLLNLGLKKNCPPPPAFSERNGCFHGYPLVLQYRAARSMRSFRQAVNAVWRVDREHIRAFG